MIAKPTRRQLISSTAMALGGLTATSALAQSTSTQEMSETQSTGVDGTKTFLHQEEVFKATPQRIYEILLDSKLFAAFSGEPAEINPQAGGTFTMFGGRVEGRNIELVPNQRIVQAWRAAHWDPGDYSIVRFVLKPESSDTRLVLDHTGFHLGDYGHLYSGWKEHYWGRLRKYLG